MQKIGHSITPTILSFILCNIGKFQIQNTVLDEGAFHLGGKQIWLGHF